MSLISAKTGYVKILQALFLGLIFVVFPLLVIFPQSAQAEDSDANESEVEYWAVIVGIADYYKDSLGFNGDITISDAQDLYDKLAPIWGEDHINLLVDDEATKGNISDAICIWLNERADSNDVVFFYFSGVGGQDCIAPYDASKYISEKAISANELRDWFDGLESSNIVAVLESGKSGTFITELSKAGRIILTSGKAGQHNWVFAGFGNSIFTYYILEALDDFPIVDSDEDYEISFEEIFAYTEPRVIESVEGEHDSQNPQMDDQYDGDLGLFYESTLCINPKNESLVAEIDGVTYPSKDFPKTFRWTPNSSHSFSINSTDSAWVSSSPMTISQGGKYHFVYLDVESAYGDPQGEGWYEEGATANISIASPLGAIVKDAFTGWSGDINSNTSQTTVYMSEPKSVVANWHKDYSQLYILVGGIAAGVVVIAVVSVSFIVKRRKIKRSIIPVDSGSTIIP